MSTTRHASRAAPMRRAAHGRLRNYFLTGLVVAGPVAITLYLTWSFVTWVDDWCGRSSRWPIGRKPICRSRSRASG